MNRDEYNYYNDANTLPIKRLGQINRKPLNLASPNSEYGSNIGKILHRNPSAKRGEILKNSPRIPWRGFS